MRVVVLAKPVPDPSVPGRLDPGSHSLVRDGKLLLDDGDAVGIELGLRLVEGAGPPSEPSGAEVVLLSVGPPHSVAALRPGLALGAARAVLVSDDAVAGSDALSTAKVMARAIRRMDPVDLIIASSESSDGYAGVVPSQLAELLDLPSVTVCRRVEVDDRVLTAERPTEEGHQIVECPLSCVITVTSGAVAPRYPSFKGIVAARSKPIEVLALDDLELAAQEVGWPGARQEIVAVDPAPPRRTGEIIDDDGHGHERIVELLERLKVI